MLKWLFMFCICLLPVVATAQDSGNITAKTTADDRGFLTAFLEDNLSGLGRKVTIAGFQGALSSRATFARLKTMKADIVLAPHPEQFGLATKLARLSANGPNPFVDPGELARTVAKSEADFTLELAKQEAAAQ